MRYCCFDLETTGLSLEEDSITELGWAVYDSKQHAPLLLQSRFITQNKNLTQEIIDITGITDEMLSEFGKAPGFVFEEFTDVLHQTGCEFVCGHNALGFDKPMLANNMKRQGLPPVQLPVLDTKIDLPLKYKPKSTALAYMLADHGKLNPFPHRAIFDALACGLLLQNYNLNELIDIIQHPIVEIRAVVSYDQRGLAQKQGYYWNADRKFWMKSLRECNLAKEQEAAQGKFQVVVVS